MSRDTWDPESGTDVPINELLGYWRNALAKGADGVTVSGGEPLAQALSLDTLLREIRQTNQEAIKHTGAEYDIMLYTGYEPGEMDEAQEMAARRADVLVTGRYRAAEPTSLIWRGSANQRLRLQTDLARRRYAEYLEFSPSEPPIQIGVEPNGFWLIGVPRKGTLNALERSLSRDGLRMRHVSWRPN